MATMPMLEYVGEGATGRAEHFNQSVFSENICDTSPGSIRHGPGKGVKYFLRGLVIW